MIRLCSSSPMENCVSLNETSRTLNQAVYWTATVGTRPKFISMFADFVCKKIKSEELCFGIMLFSSYA